MKSIKRLHLIFTIQCKSLIGRNFCYTHALTCECAYFFPVTFQWLCFSLLLLNVYKNKSTKLLYWRYYQLLKNTWGLYMIYIHFSCNTIWLFPPSFNQPIGFGDTLSTVVSCEFYYAPMASKVLSYQSQLEGPTYPCHFHTFTFLEIYIFSDANFHTVLFILDIMIPLMPLKLYQ